MKMKRNLARAFFASVPLIGMPSLGAADHLHSIQSGGLGMSSLLLTRQNLNMLSMAERSSVVLGGSIVKVNASNEPLQAASNQTIVIRVSKVYAGQEVVGNQKGQLATIVLQDNPTIAATQPRVGTSLIFFGNPKFIGKSITIVSIGQVPERDTLAEGKSFATALQARQDFPIRLVLRVSDMVFRGKVEKVESLGEVAGRDRREKEPESEHDPDWQVATVRVISSMRGARADSTVQVLFAGSDDIMWFASPKFKAGDDGIFMTRKPQKGEEVLLRSTGATAMLDRLDARLLTHHAAFQPASQEKRIQALVKMENR